MSEERFEDQPQTEPRFSNRGLGIAAIVLLFAAVISVIYVVREHGRVRELAGQNQQITASLYQTRAQLDAVTAKLNALSAAAPTTPPPTAPPAALSNPPATARASRRQTTQTKKKLRQVEDPRWKQVQSDLADQRKQIEATQQDLAKTREALEGNLNTARQELGGSIARTHEELVALQKRGERNYYEFDLTKSKQFRRTGPLSLSLRKTNTKRQHYSLVMLVDDIQLTKKNVNLYEPVLFYPAGSVQHLELVVNRIGKDAVHGYVSEPKYARREAATTSSTSEPAGSSSADVAFSRRAESQ